MPINEGMINKTCIHILEYYLAVNNVRDIAITWKMCDILYEKRIQTNYTIWF